jgi:hypothetical protein
MGRRGAAPMLRREGSLCNVYVQLFKGKDDPPPIYQVVVGRLAPAVLQGEQNSDAPVAGKVVIRRVAPLPTRVIVDGAERPVKSDEDIEYPINLDASDFARFLAKVGLGYAIFELQRAVSVS